MNFSIKYGGDLIVENLRNIKDIEYIKSAKERYEAFESSIKARGATLISICKRPREWNRNERFYDYEIGYKDKYITLSGQILSRMQHQLREPIDRFPYAQFEEFLEEIDSDAKYLEEYKQKKEREAKELEEYHEAYEAAYQGIEHGDGINEIKLTKAQNKLLFVYLKNKNLFSTCDGTLKHTVEWVIRNISVENRAGVLESIRQGGGFCDCEVLMNYFK